MQTLGHLNYNPAISDADLLSLSSIAEKSPLAGMFFIASRANHDQVLLDRMVKRLLAQQPENPLVIAHIAYHDTTTLRPYAGRVTSLIRRYPQNALLAHTEVWMQRTWGDREHEVQAAQRAIANSPHDPDTWLTLGFTLGNIGQDLRKCRTADRITPAEWTDLSRIYGQWVDAIVQATHLDPHYGAAWQRLSQAATFAGETELANTAFGKALSLEKDKSEVYAWGLEMYQPKWSSDAATLDKVAHLAAADHYTDADSAITIAGELRSAGFADLATDVITHYAAEANDTAVKEPDNAFAHWDYGAILHEQHHLTKAVQEYRAAEHLMPNAPMIHYWLGSVLDDQNLTHEAIAQYNQAIALNPFYAKAHFDLGYDLKHIGEYGPAQEELRLAMRLDPRDANVHYGLADLFVMEHHDKPAIAEYREAVRMSPYFMQARENLCSVLDEDGQYDASIEACSEAVRLQPNNTRPLDTIADDYLHKKQYTACLAECQAILKINPHDACAYENLGEGYIGEGKKAEARAEWQQVLRMDQGQIAQVARQMLAKYP